MDIGGPEILRVHPTSRGGAPGWRAVSTMAGMLALVAAVMVLTGCQAPAQPAGPTEMVLRIPDYEAFLDESASILRRYDFPPEYIDRTRGLVITHPATSGQWFEPWRVDSRGGYQLLESSLHTMRRIVTLNVEPLNATGAPIAGEMVPPGSAATTQPAPSESDDQPSRYRVTVRVDKSRSSAPERQVTTASGAMAIYSGRIPTVEGVRGSGRHQWTPLGRDGLLEAFLLAEIAKATPDVVAAD